MPGKLNSQLSRGKPAAGPGTRILLLRRAEIQLDAAIGGLVMAYGQLPEDSPEADRVWVTLAALNHARGILRRDLE